MLGCKVKIKKRKIELIDRIEECSTRLSQRVRRFG